ncbi:MAG: recombinase family protein [Lachnospiraceae bacterium]|nr:recombinase family protein [Lachnospiraceae bacterium]
MNKHNLTILYSRLSVDDDRDGESGSIQNQKMLLETYAERNDLKPYIHASDDGYSGTGWDRPGWQKVVEEIEAGRVKNIVVKNLDRIGRDYLRVGLLMEMLTEKSITLIAVQDGIDTSRGEDDFTPFRAILAEWYARDCSKKIRAIFRAKEQDGKHVSPAVPYGYLRDKEDKQMWVVDEGAAVTVRRIFNMIIDGYGVAQIAKILTEEKVLNPSAHSQTVGGEMNHHYSDPHQWRSTTVATIIERREYLGHTINRKSYTDSYKSKQRKFTSKDEQLVFENTHPAIVSEEVWSNAQRLRRTIRRSPKSDMPPSRLTGLLFCKDCGAKMTYRASAPGHGDHNEFVCSRYRKQSTVYADREGYCTQHYIRVPLVEEAILFTIKTVAKYVLKNEADFIERVRESSVIRQRESVKETRKKITKAEKRQGELIAVVKKLLEANATGRIPDSHFDKMFTEYADEQESLDKNIAEWKKQVADFDNDGTRADKFIELVKSYTEFTELSTQMLNEFIDKVYIHERDKTSRRAPRKLDIYLNFIGNISIPIDESDLVEELSAEELEKLERQRQRANERCRAYRARKKERIAAEKAVAENGKNPNPAA